MDPEDSNPGPKKRVRTISNLTQEQIRKKRDNDREAQRAFRERTKTRIQALEDELTVLKSERNGEDISSIQVVKDLREENASLKIQLRRIREIANSTAAQAEQENENENAHTTAGPQPDGRLRKLCGRRTAVDTDAAQSISAESHLSVSNTQLPSPATADQGEAREATLQRGSFYDPVLDQTTGHEGLPNQDKDLDGATHHGAQSISNVESFGPIIQARHNLQTYEYPQSPPRSTGFSPEGHLVQDGTSISMITHQQDQQFVQNRPFSPGSPHYLPAILDHQNYDGDQPVIAQSTEWASHHEPLSRPSDTPGKSYENTESDNYLDGGIITTHSLQGSSVSPHATTSSPSPALSSSWVQPETIEQLSMYNILPKHLAATCPLDQILIDFLTSRRLLAAQGTPITTLVGPPKPSISGLLNPKFKTAAHAASRVMVDVVSTFKDTNLREQLGFLYIMYATMRWQIAPDQETFENLPLWLRPTVLQVMVPHAAWIDNIPWPGVRDHLIQNPVKYPFRDFSETYARCARLSWPFEPEDAVMPKSDDSGEVLMNPLFEKHVRTLGCWSVGEPFKERFPELAVAMKS